MVHLSRARAMRAALVVLPAMTLAGCFVGFRSTTDPGTVVNVRVSIRSGHTTAVPGTGLALRFDGVASDSRCPAAALCVHAGSADVDLTTSIDALDRRARLRIPSPAGQRIDVDRYTIELVQLDPYPYSDRPIVPAAYVATVVVRGG